MENICILKTKNINNFNVLFQLISLYPHLMPSGTSFMRAHPPLHEIADVRMLTKGKEENLKEYKNFLLAFLQEISGTRQAHGFQKVCNCHKYVPHNAIYYGTTDVKIIMAPKSMKQLVWN